MPAALTSKEDVIKQLSTVFRTHGYEGSTLTLLSEATGLVKASLYHYFPKGKQDMALAVINQRSETFRREVMDPINPNLALRDQFKCMCDNLIHFYDQGRVSCSLEVFSMGQAKLLFRDYIAKGIENWILRLANMLKQGGFDEQLARQRAIDAIVRVEGALVVARAAGNQQYFIDTLNAIPDQLLAPPDQASK